MSRLINEYFEPPFWKQVLWVVVCVSFWTLVIGGIIGIVVTTIHFIAKYW